MNPSRFLPVILLIVAALSPSDISPFGFNATAQEPEHAHEHDHDDHDDHDDHKEGGVRIPTHVAMTPEAAKAAGASLSEAGRGMLPLTFNATGTIVMDPGGLARARARFAGVVRDVRRTIGDKVASGDVLATVESNDSLQSYAVKSPIAGVVISRDANVGEVADDSAMFVVADPDRVIAEAHVNLVDLSRAAVGQEVLLATADGAVTGRGKLASLPPIVEPVTQTVVARIALADVDGRWRSGMMVDAAIVHATREAPILVPLTAIQTYDTTQVVFVAAGDVFEVRPVLLGDSGGDVVEVIEGLYEGEIFVSANSIIMKGGD